MGDMFAFVGSQYKVQVGEREFFIDLLLYHRRLRCLVALELKIGEFEPEYIGKMQCADLLLPDVVIKQQIIKPQTVSAGAHGNS
jgi:hypothetical protein